MATYDLRILVVEDRERWRKLLQETLRQLSPDAQVDVASNYEAALRAVRDRMYDLVTIDLALSGSDDDTDAPDQLGLELLRELRDSKRNANSRYSRHSAGLIVLTAFGTVERARQAFRNYAVDNFIDKADFDIPVFLEAAREAIRNARFRRAAARANERYHLTITCGPDHFVGSELAGPGLGGAYTVDPPHPLKVEELVRRTNNLDILIRGGGPDAWRPDARAIGEAIYEALAAEPRILTSLTSARSRAQPDENLWVQFNTLSSGLGLPFELLYDGSKYLGRDHILTRRLLHSGASFSHKTEPFHVFVQDLIDHREPLRVLVVGANTGGIPAAETEARTLADGITADLEQLGIEAQILLLIGADASYERVGQELSEGGFHIFHYAGHGVTGDRLAENGGLVLQDEGAQVTMTAAHLHTLAQGTNLRIVYLSCCLGAYTAIQSDRGDFSGMLEALARGDVPVVLGYRWTVADQAARQLARIFYQQLWRTFSPGEALLEARRAMTLGPRGLDDETWMAPVLLMQNGYPV